jgi:hypothetical protein
MAKPKTLTLNKKQQNTVLKEFQKGNTNARAISNDKWLPHRQIMLLLEQEGLKTYAPGSYN